MARITRFGSVPHRNGPTLNVRPNPEHVETIGTVPELLFEKKKSFPLGNNY